MGGLPTPSTGSPPRRSRALVIDGHAAVRSTFAHALAAIDCDAATARDGQEALALVRETLQTDATEDDRPRPFELVIMDLVLPRTDGTTLLGQLRKSSR
jgi:CheY-like chemotaxis protein